MTLRVYVTSNEVPEEALEIVRRVADVKVNDRYGTPARDVLLREVAEVDGLYCNITERIDAELIAAAKNLKVVASMSVGFDHIDLEAATRRGIMATHTPGVLTEAVADETFGLMLALARRLVEADGYVRAGSWKLKWSPMLLVGRDVYAKTLGIYGLGRIGIAVAKRAKGFGMRVIYYDAFRNTDAEAAQGIEFRSKDEVVRESDFLSVHVPLTPETRNSIGEREFGMMKRTAYVVNTARGGVVDEKALIQALRAGTIAGAALDVFEKEPVEPDNPLLGMKNVILAPHLASGSIESRTAMAVLAAENLVAGLTGGVPANLVNRQVLEKRGS
ncbi:MAG: D-glycerate dehydrogenase [Nitrososphaerales archaeon]|jgi:glyoxylate reductase